MTDLNANLNVQVEAEFQITIRNSDGSIKHKYDTQSNLITDNGLNVLAFNSPKDNTGNIYTYYSSLFSACFIGTGSGIPKEQDVALFAPLLNNSSSTNPTNIVEDCIPVTRPNHVKVSSSKKFIFTDIDNKNITEIGLGVFFSGKFSDNSAKYCLFTHALVKDNKGTPTTITVLKGEILEINYTVNRFFDIRPVIQEIDLEVEANGATTKTRYNYMVMLTEIANANAYQPIGISSPQNSYLFAYETKETLAELKAAGGYNLATKFPRFISNPNRTQMNTLVNNTCSAKYQDIGGNSVEEDSWKMQAGYSSYKVLTPPNGNTRIMRWGFSPYTGNFEKGIRLLWLNCTVFRTNQLDDTGTAASLLIAFSNKATGEGLLKTEDYIFNIELTTTVSRMV